MIDSQGASDTPRSAIDGPQHEDQGDEAAGEEEHGILPDERMALRRRGGELLVGVQEEVQGGGDFDEDVKPKGERGEVEEGHPVVSHVERRRRRMLIACGRLRLMRIASWERRFLCCRCGAPLHHRLTGAYQLQFLDTVRIVL